MSTGYFVTKDGGGNIRAEFGNLPAYTDPNGVVSAAQFGSRLRDPSGNILYDPSGHQQVTTSLGLSANNSSQVVAAGGGWVDITGSSFTITVPRQVNIDYRIWVCGYLTAAGGGNSTAIRGNIVGYNTSAQIQVGNSNLDSNFIWFYGSLPAGSYTTKMQANATGSNYNVVAYFHQVFSLGS